MKSESLVLVFEKKIFNIFFKDYTGPITKSDIPELLGKSATFMWKWARFKRAKVYFKDFFSNNGI